MPPIAAGFPVVGAPVLVNPTDLSVTLPGALSVAGNETVSGSLAVTGAMTTQSVNGNTITAGTGVLTLAAGKTLTANNSIALSGTDGKTLTVSNSLGLAGTDGKTLTVSNSIGLVGTDGTTMTLPSTSATLARTDAANAFTGNQTVTGAVAATDVITSQSGPPYTCFV